jgi:hypothetical protein
VTVTYAAASSSCWKCSVALVVDHAVDGRARKRQRGSRVSTIPRFTTSIPSARRLPARRAPGPDARAQSAASANEQTRRRLSGRASRCCIEREACHGDARVGVPGDRPPAAVGPLPL